MRRSFDVGRKEHHVRYIQKWTIRTILLTRRGRKKLRVAVMVAISEVDYALRFPASPVAVRSPLGRCPSQRHLSRTPPTSSPRVGLKRFGLIEGKRSTNIPIKHSQRISSPREISQSSNDSSAGLGAGAGKYPLKMTFDPRSQLRSFLQYGTGSVTRETANAEATSTW